VHRRASPRSRSSGRRSAWARSAFSVCAAMMMPGTA
jgi:hypothetical protein